MARQTIPRFDLYGELGIDPSADSDAIEAAYQAKFERQQPDVGGRADRRIVRLRLARDWLTDSELRNRYDASRARAAVRAEKAAEAEARELAGTASEEAAGTGAIPWPAQDLDRPAAGIHWSSTPGDGFAGDATPKARRRLPIGAVAIVALAVVVAVGTYLFVTGLGPTAVADRDPTASPPAQTVGTATSSPQPAPTADPTVAPTTAPTAPGDPGLAVMQQRVWDTIQALEAAAATGDVAGAQALLGETAPGLRASGLRRATFPQLEVGDISTQREGTLYVALAGDDRLISTDGITWTFDYGDRPLAAYRSPGAEPVHDLWWVESDGEHHLFLRVTVATISRSEVTANVTWSFDPARPDDATYFRLAGLVISTVALDGVDYPVTDETVLISGSTALTLTGTFEVEAGVTPQLLLGITVANPRSLGDDPRLIDTGWTLTVR